MHNPAVGIANHCNDSLAAWVLPIPGALRPENIQKSAYPSDPNPKESAVTFFTPAETGKNARNIMRANDVVPKPLA